MQIFLQLTSTITSYHSLHSENFTCTSNGCVPVPPHATYTQPPEQQEDQVVYQSYEHIVPTIPSSLIHGTQNLDSVELYLNCFQAPRIIYLVLPDGSRFRYNLFASV